MDVVDITALIIPVQIVSQCRTEGYDRHLLAQIGKVQSSIKFLD